MLVGSHLSQWCLACLEGAIRVEVSWVAEVRERTGSEALRIDSSNSQSDVALEVTTVESEDRLHFVCKHDGNKPCVMDLDAGDAKVFDDLTPTFVGVSWIGEPRKGSFELIHEPARSIGIQSQPIAVNGPGGHVPSFDEVLAGDEEIVTLLSESLHGCSRRQVEGIL